MPFLNRPPPPPAGALLAALHGLQGELGYLPRERLRQLAADLGVPLTQVYGAATFYSAFGFEPRGRHTIQVCMGTACYIRGAGRLLDKLVATLGVQPGQTTQDRLFTLETVYCLGSCSMSPVIRIGEEVCGRLEPRHIPELLARYRELPAGAAA